MLGSGIEGSGDEGDVGDPDPPAVAGDVIGDHVLVRLLGAGATGSVYEARNARSDERVAIKVLHRRCSVDPRAVARFAGEARTVQRIGHPNIVGVLGVGETPDGRRYHVMELVDGGTLGDLLAHRGALEPDEALPILCGIAGALNAAHARGIAHRDLKPDNVLLARDADGRVVPRLGDFGLARLVDDGARSGTLTETGAILGTPHYMAPEQSKGSRVDQRADVYAFGVLAYRILVGRLPFTGDDPLEILLKHRHEPPIPPSRARPGLGAAIDAPILAMLAKAPDARPASVSAAFAELERALRTRAPTTVAKPGRRLAVAGASVAAAAAVAVWIVIGARWTSGDASPGDPIRPSARTSVLDAGLRRSGAREHPPERQSVIASSDERRDGSADLPALPGSPRRGSSPAPRYRRRGVRPGPEDPERAFP